MAREGVVVVRFNGRREQEGVEGQNKQSSKERM